MCIGPLDEPLRKVVGSLARSNRENLMALDSVHPRYAALVSDWVQVRDFALGERAVKAKGREYLPPTQGMLLDGMGARSANPAAGNGSGITGTANLGQAAYDAYLLRAVFPEYMKDALEIFMGMLHNKNAVIELPEKMESLRDNATEMGEPLQLLLQRINLEQLTTGRLGLLGDLPVKPDPRNPMPFIAMYIAEACRNWDNDAISDERAELNLVVLDESGYARDAEFMWNIVKKFRVLMLEDKDGGREYKCGVYVDSGTPVYDPEQMRAPAIRGKTLDSIPFVFVNSKDISPDPDEPPLMGLARLCAAIYRGEADYRQNLFMQGQDTLVVIGERTRAITDPTAATLGEEPLRTGAGSRIELETGGDAKYVGVQSQGLTEQRYALENDRKRAESRSGQLIDAAKGDKESGTALKTRVGAQTATLNQIAKTGAFALELILKRLAVWMGEDPAKVKVQPNFEFADYQMSGQDLVNLMTAKRTQGAPLSLESIHRLMVQGNLTQLDYVSETELIKTEPEFETPEAKLAKETAKLAADAAAAKPQVQPLGPGPAPKDPALPVDNS